MAEGVPPEDVGWERHRREQLLRFLEATPAQRLAWLEEMILLAHRTGALPRRGEEAPAAVPPGAPPETTPVATLDELLEEMGEDRSDR